MNKDTMKKKQSFKFGDEGIWSCPASEDRKAQKIPAKVLEQVRGGLLYIFTSRPIIRGYDNLTYRTATIPMQDFEPKQRAGLSIKP